MAPDVGEPFEAAGPLRSAYDAVDWPGTALGPVRDWSPALRATIDLMLNSHFPMAVLWGAEFVVIYNEAYTELIGDKHPGALGRTAPQVFPEAMDFIGPMMEGVMTGQSNYWYEDAAVPLHRRGFLEECYFTFSYSPVRGEGGLVEGVLIVAAETTTSVVSARRQELLAQLAERLGGASDLDALAEQTCAVLRTDAADLPVVDLHLPGAHARSTGPTVSLDPLPPAASSGRDLVASTSDGTTTVWLPMQPQHDERSDRPGWDRSSGGMMVVQCSDQLDFDHDYRLFVRLVAAAVGHGVGRLATRAAELALQEQERGFSAALQRSLLSSPPQSDSLRIAVRYEPATHIAQVGGDWHDSFVLPDGALAVTIGDIAGHDRDAAAAMAQVRNLLRGLAYTMAEPPAAVMTALDRAMAGLAVDTIATAILARVEREPAAVGGRRLVLRWTNAGHPPPALIGPDGAVELLTSTPDVLLGVLPHTDRVDHTRVLEPGSTVVFYTDGLVDRRSQDLGEGFDWLTQTLSSHAHEDHEQLADSLLASQMAGNEDDVAILVLRVA
ncbi:MAG: serine/threonine-protein phosphatase [Marmoricola sp.]|nr:serine/threonine-protein phosphatase [Marmoricola sp.]